MKKLQILLPLAAVLLSLTGCKKDNEKSGPFGETVTFTANIGGGEKTEIYDGTKMKWSDGDAVNINGDVFTSEFPLGDYITANFVGTFTGTPTEYKAYYPASLYQSGKYVLPATQEYAGNTLSSVNPMYAYQPDVNNKTLQFNYICALVKLEVTGIGTVKQIVVTSTNNLCGEFSVSDEGGKYHAVISEGEKSVTLKCGETGVALDATTPTTFYIALPQGKLENLTFKCSGDAGVWTSQPIATADLTAGKLYTKSLENVEMKPVFSVSATTTVEFAPGNLYWDGNAFHFEANQWDYCVNDIHEDGLWGHLIGTWNPSHVSHFYWSKDAKEAVKEEYEDDEASTEDSFFTNADETTANPGFHVNGETGTNQWRTLSVNEWSYLIGESSLGRDASLREWSAVTFGESGPTVSGLIIMPDGWEGTLTATTDYTTWQSLESSGAVFLPAAGYRVGSGVSYVGSYGFYWSSTPFKDIVDYACDMYFYSGYVGTLDDFWGYGGAVRLVR